MNDDFTNKILSLLQSQRWPELTWAIDDTNRWIGDLPGAEMFITIEYSNIDGWSISVDPTLEEFSGPSKFIGCGSLPDTIKSFRWVLLQMLDEGCFISDDPDTLRKAIEPDSVLKMLNRLWPSLDWGPGAYPEHWEGHPPGRSFVVEVKRLNPGWQVQTNSLLVKGPLALDVYLNQVRTKLAQRFAEDLEAVKGPSLLKIDISHLTAEGQGLSKERLQELSEELKAAREAMDEAPVLKMSLNEPEPIKLHERPPKEVNLEVLRVYADMARPKDTGTMLLESIQEALNRLWGEMRWRWVDSQKIWEGQSPGGSIVVSVEYLPKRRTWRVRTEGFSFGSMESLEEGLIVVRGHLAQRLRRDLDVVTGPSVLRLDGGGLSPEGARKAAEDIRKAMEEAPIQKVRLHKRPPKEVNLEVLRVYADMARETGATQEEVSRYAGLAPAASDARTVSGWAMPPAPFPGAVPVVSRIRGELGVGWRDTRPEPRDFRQMPVIRWPFCPCSSPTLDDFRALGFAVEGSIDLPASEGWDLRDSAEVIGG